jgi:hypothetical protein
LHDPDAVFSDRKRQGEWAEVCFAAAAIKRGFRVAKPYGDSCPYDLLVEAEGQIKRVQVKSVQAMHKNAFRISTAHRIANKSSYGKDDTDFIAALIIPHKAWYIIPVEQIFPRKTVRVCPHRPSRRRLEKYRDAWHLLVHCREGFASI